jgi:VWFA-related protein
MNKIRSGVSSRTVILAGFCLLLFAPQAFGQQQPRPAQSDDVIRVNTELVQIDVMVFDKKGHFVEGLRPEQFSLTLDGQARSVSLFERVTSGSKLEAAQLTRGRPVVTAPDFRKEITGGETAGRLIFFFVDDVHLSAESITRTRKALLRFVDDRINSGDRVAIVSTSGQIGFLQQLTDNPAVWHEAISRLDYKRNPEGYAGKTRITEYMASEIEDSHNKQLFAYLMESVKLEYAMTSGARRGDHGNNSTQSATTLVKSRVGQISAQSKIDTRNTIEALQSLMLSSAALPGRKLVFFLSDGFVIDPRGSSALNYLHEATEVAARSGAVIYSVDMRGTFLDASIDASSSDYVDMGSRHAGVSVGEASVPRQPLNLLADETGGRTIVNSGGLGRELEQAVRETSDYYVLAWRPGSETERNARARLEVTISGRPDLRVRMRRSYFANTSSSSVESEKAKDPMTAPGVELLTALGSAQPLRTLPTSLSVGYTRNSESAVVLQTSMQIAREAFVFDPSITGQKSEVDVVGAAIDDRGLIYTFKQVVTVMPQLAPESPRLPVVWNQQLMVRPGLYQVRVAVRERTSGRTGSAMEWIEVPAASPPRFGMSSLFLGERRAEAEATSQANQPLDGSQSIRVDVDHRFARTSALRFQTYVYNPSRTAAAPDVWIEARVMRGNQQVMIVGPAKIPPDVSKDSWRLPYWSEIGLSRLSPGWYTLLVSAHDRAGASSVKQSVRFSVE